MTTTVEAVECKSCGGRFKYDGSCNGCGTYVKEHDQKTPDDELLATLHNGTWLSEQTFPDLKYSVTGLIPEGFTLLVGPPKVGKSWFVVDLLLGVASGGRALQEIVLPPARPILYLALEDGDRRMKSRCEAVYGDGGSLPEHYHYETRLPPKLVFPYIEAFLRRYPDAAMVVLDTLGKVMPQAMQGESTYQRDYRVGGDLKRIADEHPGLSVVVIHHDRKATADDFVEAVSGTNGLAGSADTIMVLSRRRGEDQALLKVTGRDVPEDEYGLLLSEGKFWKLDGKDLEEAAKNARRRSEQQNLSETSTQIIDYIRQQPSGATTKQVTDKFGPAASEYLRRHTEAGRLSKPKRGLYLVPTQTP